MKSLIKLLLVISGGAFSLGAIADTYVVNGGNYDTINIGTMFTTSMKPTASFTTSSAIPANLANADIGKAGLSLVQNFLASDGVHSFTPSNAVVGNFGVFTVSTDGSGNLTAFDFVFVTPKGAAIAPTTYDGINFTQSFIGVADKTCTGGTCNLGTNTNLSVNNSASYSGPVTIGHTTTTTTTSIPTLSEWGMIILSGLLALSAFVVMRRRQV